MKTFGKILVAIPVIAVGAYAAVGFLVVPKLAGDAIEKAVKEQCPSAAVSYDSIAFNPFTLAASVSGLAIKNYAVSGALVDFSFKSLTAHVSRLGLSEKTVGIGPVVLSDPAVLISKDLKRSASVPKKVEKLASRKKTDATTKDNWQWYVESFQVKNGSVLFTDTGLKKPGQLSVSSIDLLVGKITSDLGKTPFKATAKPLGGTLKLSGNFSVASERADVTAEAAGIHLTHLNPWLEDRAGSHLGSGALQLTGNASLANGVVSGKADTSVAALSVTKGSLQLFKDASVQVTSAKLTKLDPLTFSIANIKADLGVKKALGVDDKVVNVVGDILSAFGHKKKVDKIKNVQFDKVSVSNITYKNGRLDSTSKGTGYQILRMLNSIWSK